MGVPNAATRLPRLFSPELLAMSQWRTLYLFEFGLAAISLASIIALRLPPTQKLKAFEPLDFLTFVLYAPAIGLFCAVLGQGRLVWWTQAAWIGWALVIAIPLLALALWIGHHRANPLLNTCWLGSMDIVRFAIVTIMARIVLSEQNFGAVGLLTALGQNNDQFRTLFTIAFIASVAGVVMSAVTLNPTKLTHPIMYAIGLVAIAAYADSFSTNLTRAPELYATQAVIAFSTTFFLGPSLLFGMTRALQQGAGHVISFIALFGMLNSVGSLGGTALLGTYQVVREKAHSAAIVQNIDPTDPQVTQRIAAGGARGSGVGGGPTLGPAEGGRLPAPVVTR